MLSLHCRRRLPQDNMEFMQWMKAYFDGQTGGQPPEGYDARARRASSRTGDVKQPSSSRARQRSVRADKAT